MKILLVALWLLCTFGAAHAEEFNAKVIAVMDGDTVLALRGTQKVKIRLANIDAPEVGHAGMGGQPPNSQKGQDFGSESRQALLNMVLKKQARVNSRATDDYGRVVAELSVDGRSVNEEQVRRGMAWQYSYFRSDKILLALQGEARAARRGLWAQASPTPPWEWRKIHAAMSPLQTVAARGDACGSKHRCAQMRSCDEARFFLSRCGVKSLDNNGDGVPCESLCAPEQ